MNDQEIIEGVIHEFAGLAKHPRPSHHEKGVSDYIVSRLHELGVTDVTQDEVYNVIANYFNHFQQVLSCICCYPYAPRI